MTDLFLLINYMRSEGLVDPEITFGSLGVRIKIITSAKRIGDFKEFGDGRYFIRETVPTVKEVEDDEFLSKWIHQFVDDYKEDRK